MRKLLFVIFIFIQVYVSAQEEMDMKIWYQDTLYLFESNEEYNLWSVYRGKLKEQRLDGNFIVFYDKVFVDTALSVNLVNGKYEGLFRKWDREHKYVSQECFYKEGYRQDTCYDYVYFFPENEEDIHQDSILIEVYGTKCYNENGIDVAGEEWVEYKTIAYSEYEKATGEIRNKTNPIKPKLNKTNRDTIRRFTPKIQNGVITIKIDGRKGSAVSFGYIDSEAIKTVLAKTKMVTDKGNIVQGFITKGVLDLFIESPINCKISYSFKEFEPKK